MAKVPIVGTFSGRLFQPLEINDLRKSLLLCPRKNFNGDIDAVTKLPVMAMLAQEFINYEKRAIFDGLSFYVPALG